MSLFRKRPLVIEAVRLAAAAVVKTPEGDITGSPGDWLITGVHGEQYPCSSDTFRRSYQHVEGNRYRKRPLIVEATPLRGRIAIKTSAGTLVGQPGDWLVHGVNGSQYPCAPDVFRKTYEPVDDSLDLVSSQSCDRCATTHSAFS